MVVFCLCLATFIHVLFVCMFGSSVRCASVLYVVIGLCFGWLRYMCVVCVVCLCLAWCSPCAVVVCSFVLLCFPPSVMCVVCVCLVCFPCVVFG